MSLTCSSHTFPLLFKLKSVRNTGMKQGFCLLEIRRNFHQQQHKHMHMHMHNCISVQQMGLITCLTFLVIVHKSLWSNSCLPTTYMSECQSYNLGATCNVKLKTRSWVFEKSIVNELSKLNLGKRAFLSFKFQSNEHITATFYFKFCR